MLPLLQDFCKIVPDSNKYFKQEFLDTMAAMIGKCYNAAAHAPTGHEINLNTSSQQYIQFKDKLLVEKSVGTTVHVSECNHTNSVTFPKMDNISKYKRIHSVIYN